MASAIKTSGLGRAKGFESVPDTPNSTQYSGEDRRMTTPQSQSNAAKFGSLRTRLRGDGSPFHNPEELQSFTFGNGPRPPPPFFSGPPPRLPPQRGSFDEGDDPSRSQDGFVDDFADFPQGPPPRGPPLRGPEGGDDPDDLGASQNPDDFEDLGGDPGGGPGPAGGPEDDGFEDLGGPGGPGGGPPPPPQQPQLPPPPAAQSGAVTINFGQGQGPSQQMVPYQQQAMQPYQPQQQGWVAPYPQPEQYPGTPQFNGQNGVIDPNVLRWMMSEQQRQRMEDMARFQEQDRHARRQIAASQQRYNQMQTTPYGPTPYPQGPMVTNPQPPPPPPFFPDRSITGPGENPLPLVRVPFHEEDQDINPSKRILRDRDEPERVPGGLGRDETYDVSQLQVARMMDEARNRTVNRQNERREIEYPATEVARREQNGTTPQPYTAENIQKLLENMRTIVDDYEQRIQKRIDKGKDVDRGKGPSKPSPIKIEASPPKEIEASPIASSSGHRKKTPPPVKIKEEPVPLPKEEISAADVEILDEKIKLETPDKKTTDKDETDADWDFIGKKDLPWNGRGAKDEPGTGFDADEFLEKGFARDKKSTKKKTNKPNRTTGGKSEEMDATPTDKGETLLDKTLKGIKRARTTYDTLKKAKKEWDNAIQGKKEEDFNDDKLPDYTPKAKDVKNERGFQAEKDKSVGPLEQEKRIETLHDQNRMRQYIQVPTPTNSTGSGPNVTTINNTNALPLEQRQLLPSLSRPKQLTLEEMCTEYRNKSRGPMKTCRGKADKKTYICRIRKVCGLKPCGKKTCKKENCKGCHKKKSCKKKACKKGKKCKDCPKKKSKA